MRPLRSLAREVVRRGGRTILLTYPGLGLGNYLYFLLHAHSLRRQGVAYRVLLSSGLEPWLEDLPALREYLVAPDEVRIRDRREHIPASFLQAFGVDFTRTQLHTFVSEVLLEEPLFAGWRARAEALREERVLTVNVRRGDYYERDDFRRIYGFDVAAYVRAAVSQAVRRHGRFGRLHVVSDDAGWCRANLPWLGESTHELTFVDGHVPPRQHLADLALSPALVLANSTFSFWGGYVSNVVHGGNHASVWAPRFFGRGLYTSDGTAWQLDPLWHAVESSTGIPSRDRTT